MANDGFAASIGTRRVTGAEALGAEADGVNVQWDSDLDMWRAIVRSGALLVLSDIPAGIMAALRAEGTLD